MDSCSSFIHSIVSNYSVTDSEGPDQTARMRRLIWAFAVPICPSTRFLMARLKHKILLALITCINLLCSSVKVGAWGTCVHASVRACASMAYGVTRLVSCTFKCRAIVP